MIRKGSVPQEVLEVALTNKYFISTKSFEESVRVLNFDQAQNVDLLLCLGASANVANGRQSSFVLLFTLGFRLGGKSCPLHELMDGQEHVREERQKGRVEETKLLTGKWQARMVLLLW